MGDLPNVAFKHSSLTIDKTVYVFKGFKFIELLPSGSNAIILKAEQPVLKRIVIVKVWYKLKERDSRDKKKQGTEESVKLAKLEHPNICRIFFVGSNKDIFYAVLEYIQGETLNQFFKSSPAMNVRYNLWSQIATALSYSYQQGYYHGDLHDKNILICPNRAVKILDFGTSYFSGKVYSEDREKRMLVNLSQQLFHEFVAKEYIDINLLKLSPFHVLRGLDYWAEIISASYFNAKNEANAVAGIIHAVAQAPIFNLTILERMKEFRRNRGTYVGILSSKIELARNTELKSSVSKIYDFEVIKEVYRDWQKDYLLMTINSLEAL